MFTWGLSGLIAAYVVIGLLLLSIHVYSNWHWQIKALATLIVSGFYVITYVSLPPLMGWPVASALPERFHLIAAHVREPDKTTGEPGELYLWVTEIAGLKQVGQPRAYKLAYSQALQTKIVSAMTKVRRGLPQLGEIAADEEPHAGAVVRRDRGGQNSVNIKFYDLPDPLFPEKSG